MLILLRKLVLLSVIFGLLAACDSGEDTIIPDGDADSGELDTELSELDTEQGEADSEADQGLPQSLYFSFTRENPGDPIPAEERTAFTKKLLGLLAKTSYFDWVLRTSHGVDVTTGKPDYMLWWTSSHAEKSGDLVTFVNNETNGPDGADGGHNLMTRSSKVLSSAIAGYLMSGDERMRTITRQYCKGITATMEGMVYDENDEIHHLMARNIVTFNHSYTTHDGRKKAIDYSNWFHDGFGWNCERFEYKNNPNWGSVWVTNMRSKDDVSRLHRANAFIRYVAELAPDEDVRTACGETSEYLQRFCQDIVDHGYTIRTKDENGRPFTPGGEDDYGERSDERGDLGSYVTWDEVIPDAECNSKRAAALIAYGDGQGLECPPVSNNTYEIAAVNIHYFNMMIIRHYHLSHIIQALLHRDEVGARNALLALVDRYERDIDSDAETRVDKTQDEWDRDLATSLMQATSVGYPLNEREVRLVYKYYLRAIERYKDWPYWDLWDASVPDGEYSYQPPNVETIDEQSTYWIRVEDMGACLDSCWTPFKNPDGQEFLDCDLVRDLSKWDAAWLEE